MEHGIKRTETTSQVVRDAFMLKTLMDEYLDHGSERTLRQWDKLHLTFGERLDYEVISESIERPLLEDLKKVYRSVNHLYPRVVEMIASFDQNQDLKTKKMLTSLMSLQLEQMVIAANNLGEATQLLTLNRGHFVQQLIVALGISTVLIILINIYLIRKSVVRPLQALSAGTEKVGAGNFEQIAEIKSDDEVGKLSQAFNTMIENLQEREQEREITIKFLNLVNESHGTKDMIHAATTFFQQQSGCEAVGIRLHEGDDYPYFEARGFPKEFILLENHLCDYDDKGRVILDSDGSPDLACMCGNVISRKFDPSKPFFTGRGSFWTNCTTDLLASTTEEDRQSRTRNRCNGEGYESVALIPLRTSDEPFGLLQLNDKRKGRFTPESIALWERLAQYLSVALAKFGAERELKESEARLKESQAMAHLGSWELDVANSVLTWSDEVYRIFGLQPQEFKATYEAFLETVHPDDRKAVDEAYSGSLRNGRDRYEIEHRIVRKLTGEVRIVQEKCEHIRDGSGSIIRSVGMVHDITERKRAEENIRESQERFSLFMNNSPTIAWTKDEQGRHVYLSATYENRFGVRFEDWQGKTDFELWPRETAEEFWKNDQLVLSQNRPLEIIETTTGSDGVPCYWLNFRFPFQDALGKRYVGGIGLDITDRKHAEEALRKAHAELELRVQERTAELEKAKQAITVERQRLYDVLETLPVYVCLLDSDYRMPFANRYFRETFAEPLGLRCHDFLFNRKEPCEICETYTVMKTHSPHRWYWTGPNGRDYDIYDFPFFEADGSMLILEMGIDITERKKAEAGLQQTLADLTRSNEDLQQFAYVASHDLQEPLRNVASCLQLLEKKYKNNLDAKADELIHYAVESSVRMKTLIQDLLAFSRIVTKGKPPQRVDCEEILNQTVKNLRSSISEAGAVITHDPLPTILADDAQLSQVFQNLIGNGIKFRREEHPQIHVSAVMNNGEWIFSVKDNGIGIESRHLDRIFVIFQRLHKRSQYGGTGIGLAIVKKVVERHHGRVWVESEFGSGTTFHFTIPDKRIQT